MQTRHLLTERGASELAALMIAVGIGAVVMTANMQMFSNVTQSMKSVEKTAGALEVRRDIELLLADEKVCTKNFRAMSANGAPQTTDLMQAGGNVAMPFGNNKLYENGTVKVVSWSLNDSVVLNNVSPAKQLVQMNILFQRMGQSPGGDLLVRTVGLYSRRSGAANSAIDSCYSLAGSGSDIWLKVPSTTNIYNADLKNVAIGTAVATVPLYVSGNFRTSLDGTLGAMKSNTDYDGTGDVWVSGKAGVAPGLGPARFTVGGNAMFANNLTFDSQFDTTTVNVTGNSSIGTNIYVALLSRLASTVVLDTTEFFADSDFIGAARFGSTVNIAGNVNIRGPATAELSVNGDADIANRINADITQSATGYCINGMCKTDWSTKTCGLGEVIHAVHTDGTVECANPNCPAGTFYQGLDGAWQPICKALPTPTCAVNTYIDNYNAVTGVYTCTPINPGEFLPQCPAGQYLVSVTNGVPVCLPTQLAGMDCSGVPGNSVRQVFADGTVRCFASFTDNQCVSVQQVATGILANGTVVCGPSGIVGSCAAGEVVLNFDSAGAPVCGSPSVVGGTCSGNGIRSIGVNANVNGCM